MQLQFPGPFHITIEVEREEPSILNQDGDQPPNRWWVEEDGNVVEFASEAEAVEYSRTLGAPPMVMCQLRQLIGGA